MELVYPISMSSARVSFQARRAGDAFIKPAKLVSAPLAMPTKGGGGATPSSVHVDHFSEAHATTSPDAERAANYRIWYRELDARRVDMAARGDCDPRAMK